ncbi:hypothetical protein A3D77_05025 [Candidatus Gottesmanbacteria bacterium RIFCSPHIGHO2_02_FULL_39_11]|uniref:Uncharacterized protein n=1 Tax=Candidatus Gottesmanbacteria bacterium RIFCSPHIGHO2_02_FULL_39_11 TaxID=1798382 RepID=A0A1F5ZLV2_9BACT|nr:MAG: hypothetical protein A3D77_05025 [Candidatus Gottesmanbacteria bacterium RIFCSPHIGHO2_02_FULL_39_11]
MINHIENRVGKAQILEHPVEQAGLGLRILSDTIANNNGKYQILWQGDSYPDENGEQKIHEVNDGYTPQRNDPAESFDAAG